MGKQPTHVTPFLPFGSQKNAIGGKTVVTDDRRDIYGSLPGGVWGNEVVVQPSGAWPDPLMNTPAITEILRITLPRPEPVTLFWEPYAPVSGASRFRPGAEFPAHVNAVVGSVALNGQARIIVEFGVGSARHWTYCDMAVGSLCIPSCSWATISGWSYFWPLIVNASAQLGYTQNAHAKNTSILHYASVASVLRPFPNFARDVSVYFSPTKTDATGSFWGGGVSGMEFYFTSPSAGNPPVIPYPPVKLPIAGNSSITLNVLFPGAVPGMCNMTAVSRIYI